ncbi:zinc finger protein 12-like isoform X3 [Neoarius graeffei]|uniref:zinc finger protein 12-like isoform X3 n=1 Tax=Neoarius graeffei TaxID=443677 RepID=UPI00298C2B19|nr:zinc finger protein 12-like isoform X3 [Neoarius graeffei]
MDVLCPGAVADVSLQDPTVQLKQEEGHEQEFQDFFPDSFLPTMRPTLMQHHEDGAGEIHRPQEDMNSLILDIKTEPDLLDIDAFVYNDEHEDFSTSKDGWDCESEQENEFTLEQCDDECSTLTIIKKELTEEELSFCGELQSNCKSESIELSNSEEEEVVCDTLLEETEVTMTGECSYLPSAKVFKSCSECGKMFPTSSSYNRHMRIHSGERPFQCAQCNKTFTQFSSFKIHQRIHTGEKPYHCSECEKTFSRLDALHLHQRTHTGEKPYKCTHCPKTFTRLHVLQNHQRTHTGIKPYQCSHCAKTFTRLCSFKIHKRRHTGEKPYLCGTCGKQFVDASNLKNHQRTHTKERPYQCSLCNKTFIQLGHLTSHRRKTHSIEIVTVL